MSAAVDDHQLYGLVRATELVKQKWILEQPAFCRLSAAEITAKLAAMDTGRLLLYRVLELNNANVGGLIIARPAFSWAQAAGISVSAALPPGQEKRELAPCQSSTESKHPGFTHVRGTCEECGTACYVSRLLMELVIAPGLADVACRVCYRQAGYRDVSIHPVVLEAMGKRLGPAAVKAAVAQLDAAREDIRDWLEDPDRPYEPLTPGEVLHSIVGASDE